MFDGCCILTKGFTKIESQLQENMEHGEIECVISNSNKILVIIAFKIFSLSIQNCIDNSFEVCHSSHKLLNHLFSHTVCFICDRKTGFCFCMEFI